MCVIVKHSSIFTQKKGEISCIPLENMGNIFITLRKDFIRCQSLPHYFYNITGENKKGNFEQTMRGQLTTEFTYITEIFDDFMFLQEKT